MSYVNLFLLNSGVARNFQGGGVQKFLYRKKKFRGEGVNLGIFHEEPYRIEEILLKIRGLAAPPAMRLALS